MPVKTYGLVGKSGTGKSYHAMTLCWERKIEAIVDDGLFILRGGVAAGISAKRQATKVGAIKTALFLEEAHQAEVIERIREENPASLLILGTSVKMIQRIAQRLELPPVTEMVSIEEITTEEERLEARRQRSELGKHVIPVPTFQLKRQFSGYFLDPLRMFRGRGGRSGDLEKTVVRPTYSYLGDFTISDKVITDIVSCVAAGSEGAIEAHRVYVINRNEGIRIQAITSCKMGIQVADAARAFQKLVVREVEHMTAFNVIAVDVDIRGLRSE